ncbi:MAG: hypothetical protein OK439_06160 [Thaumarchaeota archaeon]|nr:hypothetical protein [Nitrososphaerota archaeon]
MTIKEPKIPGYDVICTTDKTKRDDIFRQMRESSDPLERASVKFSGNEIVPDEFGEGGSDGKFIHYSVSGSKSPRFAEIRNKMGKLIHPLSLGPKSQWRPKYISTWSIATPRG